jgi:hypothetical protein
MINQIVLAVLLTLVSIVVTFPVHAGVLRDAGKARDIAKDIRTQYDLLLESLLQRVKGKDSKFGDTKALTKAFRELRFAYAETSQYNPYKGIKAEVGPVMLEAYKNNEYNQALQYSEKILKENFVDFDAHFTAYQAYQKIGNQEKADYHSDIARLLIDSILSDGDGNKPETAMEVISVEEEYIILAVKGLRAISYNTLQAHGHNYDKLTVVDSESGKTFEMYFCIDKPYHWLLDSLKKPIQ